MNFYNAYDVNMWERKFRQKYGSFIYNRFLYRISSFHEKRIDTAED